MHVQKFAPEGAEFIRSPGMPKGQRVTISAGSAGALTAFVTYPHWEEARG